MKLKGNLVLPFFGGRGSLWKVTFQELLKNELRCTTESVPTTSKQQIGSDPSIYLQKGD